MERMDPAMAERSYNSNEALYGSPDSRNRRSTRLLTQLLLLFSLCHLGITTAGTSLQSPQSIRETVKIFINQKISKDFPHHEIKVSSLDPRLKLAPCNVPLQGFLPSGRQAIGNTTVGVRCTGSKPWTIYVPAFVKAMRKVVVTSHPVLRHATISSADVRLEERDISVGSNPYIFSLENVVGKIAKRAMANATALSPAMLDAPLLVHRGEKVIILAEATGIQVRMAGTALMDGTEGQIIRARNTRSKRMVEGQVIKPGIIRVNM